MSTDTATSENQVHCFVKLSKCTSGSCLLTVCPSSASSSGIGTCALGDMKMIICNTIVIIKTCKQSKYQLTGEWICQYKSGNSRYIEHEFWRCGIGLFSKSTPLKDYIEYSTLFVMLKSKQIKNVLRKILCYTIFVLKHFFA